MPQTWRSTTLFSTGYQHPCALPLAMSRLPTQTSPASKATQLEVSSLTELWWPSLPAVSPTARANQVELLSAHHVMLMCQAQGCRAPSCGCADRSSCDWADARLFQCEHAPLSMLVVIASTWLHSWCKAVFEYRTNVINLTTSCIPRHDLGAPRQCPNQQASSCR